MNFEVAEKALQFLEAEPRRLDMNEGIQKSFKANLLEDEPPCGTACCFAGAVVLSHAPESVVFDTNGKVIWNPIETAASRLLGIGLPLADRIFYVSEWPEKFKWMYLDAKTQKERVASLRGCVESFKNYA